MSPPTDEAIRILVRQLQESAALLMQQDLGPDDAQLRTLREGAEEYSSVFPAVLDEGSRAEAWPRVRVLGIVAEGLLRRWCQTDTAGGVYEIRVEEDERGGYYVWNSARSARASMGRGDARQPVGHLALPLAWGMTRDLNQRAG